MQRGAAEAKRRDVEVWLAYSSALALTLSASSSEIFDDVQECESGLNGTASLLPLLFAVRRRGAYSPHRRIYCDPREGRGKKGIKGMLYR